MEINGMTQSECKMHCADVVQAQKKSGLSVSEWCRQNGVAKTTFYRYRHRAEACTGTEPETPRTSSGTNGTVRNGRSGTEPEGVSVVLGPLSIQVEPGADLELLEEVLKVVKRACC